MTITEILVESDLVRERVNRGVELLDETFPDWANMVQKQILRMDHCSYCVLGQMFGIYNSGLATIGMSHDAAIEHGFDFADGDFDQDEVEQRYAELEFLWKYEIDRRRTE
jgi:hypothetical protein